MLKTKYCNVLRVACRAKNVHFQISIIFLQVSPSYWKAWHDFEVRHGNEDTFREMLRIKRSVQAQFNTQVYIFSYFKMHLKMLLKNRMPTFRVLDKL